MNFTQKDLFIVLTMTTTIILLVFTVNAMGLADESVSESEIPEFNTSKGTFDLAGTFPENPGTPARGTLWYAEDLQGDSENSLWLHGDTNDGVQLVLISNSSDDTIADVTVNNWTNGNVVTDEYNLQNPGDRATHNNFSYKIDLEYTKIENENQTNQTIYVKYEIENTPADTQWYSRIPLVGGLFSSGADLAGILGWIGATIWWVITAAVEVSLNAVIILYNVLSFFIGIMHFLLSTYSAIITGVAPWASLLLAIPGVLMMFEFTKLILIGISLLPLT